VRKWVKTKSSVKNILACKGADAVTRRPGGGGGKGNKKKNSQLFKTKNREHTRGGLLKDDRVRERTWGENELDD